MLNSLRKNISRPSVLVFCFLLFASGCGITFYFRNDLLEAATLGLDVFQTFLRQTHPAIFFSLLAVLPAFGLPISPFFMISAVYGIGFSLICTVAALSVNLTLIYWLGVGVFHPVIERFIRRTRYSIPKVRPSDYSKITLLVRITPGLPYFVQGYLLALGGIPFGIYFIISIIVSTSAAAAFIFLGESVFQGKSGPAILGICLLLVLILAAKIIRDRYAKTNEKKSATSG